MLSALIHTKNFSWEKTSEFSILKTDYILKKDGWSWDNVTETELTSKKKVQHQWVYLPVLTEQTQYHFHLPHRIKFSLVFIYQKTEYSVRFSTMYTQNKEKSVKFRHVSVKMHIYL